MNDHQLRRALKSKVLARYAKDPNTRIVDELGLRHGVGRIDIAVVNGIIHGYELKSDKDNLKRLPHQIQIYSSVLDKVTLVVGIRHAHKATKVVPDWWGIKIAKVGSRGAFEFESYRTARVNPSVDPLSVCKLLWRDEAGPNDCLLLSSMRATWDNCSPGNSSGWTNCMIRVEIKPELLSWARERAGFDIDGLTHRFPKLAAWEQGTAQPTLKQIEKFATATSIRSAPTSIARSTTSFTNSTN